MHCWDEFLYKNEPERGSGCQKKNRNGVPVRSGPTATLVVKATKSCHITPILRSLHWLRITERIEYKLLSLTYKYSHNYLMR